MVLGPLDKRAIRTRCQACAKRQIKCEGGRPCSYCTKKNIICISQATKTRQSLIIVNHTQPPSDVHLALLSQHSQRPSLNRIYSKDVLSRFINHFFTTFIVNNGFGVKIDLDTIISQFQSCPSLYHASVAVGALDLSKKSSPRPELTFQALKSYRSSVTSFQSELQKPDFLKSDDGLWTTLFLGIFELMYDVSGEGWIKHILYGTSKILQLRGPEAHSTGNGRSFFLAVRAFEISRALIYSDPSFLHQPPWKALMNSIWEGDLIQEWHPKEALFDLMLESVELCQSVWETLDPEIVRGGDEAQSSRLKSAAAGLVIRNSLDSWHSNFEIWNLQDPFSSSDSRSILATIYYHAISIYLSGLFDYRSQYDNIPTPTLDFQTIQFHVNGILSTTIDALKTTNLAGLMFFFPLRVAGARSVSSEQRQLILGMLKEISDRNYIVADAFVSDLENLWSLKVKIG